MNTLAQIFFCMRFYTHYIRPDKPNYALITGMYPVISRILHLNFVICKANILYFSIKFNNDLNIFSLFSKLNKAITKVFHQYIRYLYPIFLLVILNQTT